MSEKIKAQIDELVQHTKLGENEQHAITILVKYNLNRWR